MNKIVKYKEYIILSILMLVICLFMFGKVLFLEYEFLPPDSYSAKAVEQGFYLSEEKYNQYPLWLPWMFSGLPSVHSFQNISDYYYPYKIFKILRDFGVLRFYEFVLHFIFAGLGMFILLKRLKCNFISSMFGAVSYITIPYLIANLVHGHGSLMMTASYIPWIIWGLINLFEKRTLFSVGTLGLLIGFQLQRAHVQIAYYTWMMVGLYVIFYIIESIYNKNNIFLEKTSPLIFLFGSLTLGVALSASIYMPAVSYMNESTRSAVSGGMGLTQAMGWSFPPIESIVFLLPSFFGFGGYTYWGQIEFTDYPQYMGIIVLIFAFYSYFSSNKIKYFLITSIILSILISFGKYFESFYSIFYNLLPLFDKFRVPMYILILLQFSVCALSAIGFNEYINDIKKNNSQNKILKISGLLFLLTSIIFLFKDSIINFEIKNMKYYGMPEHQILDPIRLDLIMQSFYIFLGILFILICIIKLKKIINNHYALSLAILFLSLIDVSIINYKILNPNQEEYRMSPLSKREYLDAYLKKDGVINFLLNDTTKYRIWPIQELERSNRWSAFNIESISGYHPAKLSSYNDIIKSTGFMMPSIMKTLNVKYIISLHKLKEEQLPNYLELTFSGSLYLENSKQYATGYIYSYKDYYDRFYFSKAINTLDKEKQIKELNNNYFSPKDVSMLSKFADIDINYDKNSTVQLIKWSPNEIIIKTNANTTQFLNISEIFYPGWNMRNIDTDQTLEIYKVNNLIRGAFIEKGKNSYIINYDPIENKLGSIISFVSFIILISLFFSGIKNEK